jgi:hypothetical protein
VQRNLILARKLEAKYSRAVLHRKNSHWVDKIRSGPLAYKSTKVFICLCCLLVYRVILIRFYFTLGQ